MLGSGTSNGVPMIGCDCTVCTSNDPRNQRLRSSLLVRWRDERHGEANADRAILIDTGPDLRQQVLRAGLRRLDAVLFTHAHADHIHGLDDVRPFNFKQGSSIPCYGSAETLERIRTSFAYIFDTGPVEGGGIPQLDLHTIDAPFTAAEQQVMPIPVLHGSMPVFGFRFGNFAYVTDCSHIPAASFELLDGVETLILGALRYRPHSTHFSIAEAIEAAARIGARRTWFTHLTHEVDHARPEVELPEGVAFGYDGLSFDVTGFDTEGRGDNA